MTTKQLFQDGMPEITKRQASLLLLDAPQFFLVGRRGLVFNEPFYVPLEQ